MSRPGSWGDKRPYTLPNLLNCFSLPAEFKKILQADELLLLTDTTEEMCPTDPDPSAEYPSGWTLSSARQASSFITHHGAGVHAEAVRFSMPEVRSLLDEALENSEALTFLGGLYAELQFKDKLQADYIALVRRQVAQLIGADVNAWVALQNHILTSHPEALVVALTLLPEMRSAMLPEHYAELVHQTFESGEVMAKLLDLWPRVSPELDAAGCYQAIRYYYASGNAALPLAMIARASELWVEGVHANYLSAILFEACERGDAAAIKAILRLPFAHVVAAVNARQSSNDLADDKPGDFLLHKMILAQDEAGPVFDDELIHEVLILTDDASRRCAEKNSHVTHQANPLMLAALRNRTNVMSMLLMRPEVLAHINDQDDHGYTALHHVTQNGGIVEQSLLFNAHINRGNALKLNVVNCYGETALHSACQRGDADMLRFMLFNFSLDSIAKAKKIKDKNGNLAIAYLPQGSELRSLLETSDLDRHRIEAARRGGVSASGVEMVAPYITAPKGEKRKEIYQAVAILFSQWQGGYAALDWVWSAHRTRWTHDNPAARRLLYSACEALYRATFKWEIEAILSGLRVKTMVMEDGVERSILRSDTVTDLQLSVGVLHSLHVSGLAWPQQVLLWALRAESTPDEISPYAVVPVSAARDQFAMRAFAQLPVAQVVAPPTYFDDDDNPKATAWEDAAVAVAVPPPPPSSFRNNYPRLMSAATGPAPDPSAPSLDPVGVEPAEASPPPQDNDLDPMPLNDLKV
ncbi:MAG: ankyrin repeat domain-containing protein [Coxiellaceae bacterium]|nr:ankyrin repeat domain-containing protein [Coxiellaceae bacterium]